MILLFTEPKIKFVHIILTLDIGQSRCFVFWQELLACYVVNTAGDDSLGAAKCAPALEDYYECLHHKKEVCPFVCGTFPSLPIGSPLCSLWLRLITRTVLYLDGSVELMKKGAA